MRRPWTGWSLGRWGVLGWCLLGSLACADAGSKDAGKGEGAAKGNGASAKEHGSSATESATKSATQNNGPEGTASKDDRERRRPPPAADDGDDGKGDGKSAGGPVGLFGRLETARIDTACNQALSVLQASEMFRVMKRGKCPKAVEDLKAAGVIARVQKDPWKTPYTLTCPGENSPIEVRSSGPDAVLGTDDDIVAGPEDSSCVMK